MKNSLKFEQDKYEIRNINDVYFRAYENICYCENPVDDIQRMNIYVPERYYHEAAKKNEVWSRFDWKKFDGLDVDSPGTKLKKYNIHSAPIFMPNTVGGYMPGLAATPENNNTVLRALEHGYVVVCVGIRGSSSYSKDKGYTGKAPALVVDMKAAIRYLRYNKEVIPGNVERIITSGTSAGGALSALTGASGNQEEYLPYLKAIGAADEQDHIFAANCYCPIINLENADTAYEWQFDGIYNYHQMRYVKKDGNGSWIPIEAKMSDKQMRFSKELKKEFPTYVNSLKLQDKEENYLTLDENGEGSFAEYVKKQIIKSAQKELETHDSANRLSGLAVKGSLVEEQEYLTIENGMVTGIDWKGFLEKISRMKIAPAFDSTNLQSPENAVFGTKEGQNRHFTTFGAEHSDERFCYIAEPEQVRLTNPMSFVKNPYTRHWRIRHGAYDRDTSFAISAMFALLLEMNGKQVDYHLPWGLPHSGDYDLEELFQWIDCISFGK